MAALTLGPVPIPGNLAELMQALADSLDDHSALAGILLRRLEETDYFTLMDDLMIAAAIGTDPTGTPDKIKGWRQSAQRDQQEWRSFLAISQRSPYPLWKRFARFHLRLYTTFVALIERSG